MPKESKNISQLHHSHNHVKNNGGPSTDSCGTLEY